MDSEIEDTDLSTVIDMAAILQAMYDDMIKNNVRTPARDMAGRLIHSSNFTKLANRIDHKYRFHIDPYKTNNNNEILQGKERLSHADRTNGNRKEDGCG